MSSTSAWSYVHTATIWRRISVDPVGGQERFAAPEQLLCDYIVNSKVRRAPSGEEFVSKANIFTEYSSASRGDRILIGASSAADPIAAGADEIVEIARYPDTFQRLKDDYELITG